MSESVEVKLARIDERTAFMQKELTTFIEMDKAMHRLINRVLTILSIILLIDVMGGDEVVRETLLKIATTGAL